MHELALAVNTGRNAFSHSPPAACSGALRLSWRVIRNRRAIPATAIIRFDFF